MDSFFAVLFVITRILDMRRSFRMFHGADYHFWRQPGVLFTEDMWRAMYWFDTEYSYKKRYLWFDGVAVHLRAPSGCYICSIARTSGELRRFTEDIVSYFDAERLVLHVELQHVRVEPTYPLLTATEDVRLDGAPHLNIFPTIEGLPLEWRVSS